jgi:hypothetical protein
MSTASRFSLAVVAVLGFGLPAHPADRVLMGTLGNPNGGAPFRIECEANDFLVGFDSNHTHVIDRLAPICGNKAHGGTYGRPWAGQKPTVRHSVSEHLLCPAGSLLTILHVFVDSGDLVNNVGMSCLNPVKGTHAYEIFANWQNETGPTRPPKNPSKVDRRFLCPEGMVGVGIYGRAGTALDALGLICGR